MDLIPCPPCTVMEGVLTLKQHVPMLEGFKGMAVERIIPNYPNGNFPIKKNMVRLYSVYSWP